MRMFTAMSRGDPIQPTQRATGDMLIGALLRVPARAVQRRILAGLNAAVFTDPRVPHMAVLRYPSAMGYARAC